jgi:hypothetical protein
VLGAWEHARMASSSSIRPGRVLENDPTLLFSAWWWDAKLGARQDALASAIADRQDDLARFVTGDLGPGLACFFCFSGFSYRCQFAPGQVSEIGVKQVLVTRVMGPAFDHRSSGWRLKR